MVRLVASVILLLVVAVLVVLNAEYTTPFNLFGYNIESVSVIGVALVSFAVGVLYSFILYVMHYVHRSRKRKLSARESEVKRLRQEHKKGSGGSSAASQERSASAAGSPGTGTAAAGASAGGSDNQASTSTPASRRGKKGGMLSRLAGKA